MLHKPWEVVGAYILTLLCIVDYFTKFPFVKKTSDLSAESLIKSVKIVFEEVGLPEKIVLDTGTNFKSDKFRQFCRQLNI